MATLNPIRKRSTEALALEQLRAAIVAGTLGPGTRLTEQDLSDRLGTSRATIRSALHHLVSEGLVVQVPYTGWMVISLTARDARELVSLRASLECLAAELAAASANPDARRQIDTAFETLATVAAARRTAEASAADAAFHWALIQASGHERLAQHYRLVAQQISVLIASSNALLSDPALLAGQHAPIVMAVRAGDARGAAAAVRDHIVAEGEKLVAHLAAAERTDEASETVERKLPKVRKREELT